MSISYLLHDKDLAFEKASRGAIVMIGVAPNWRTARKNFENTLSSTDFGMETVIRNNASSMPTIYFRKSGGCLVWTAYSLNRYAEFIRGFRWNYQFADNPTWAIADRSLFHEEIQI